MTLEDYGYRPEMPGAQDSGLPARVTAVHRDRFEIVCERGEGFAGLKAGAYYGGGETFPTTGDFVLVDYREGGESRILSTLPRKTLFTRADPSGHREQAVAANFDYVFLLQSLERDFNPRGLERYLTLAWQSGAVPAVLLSKADCAKDCAATRRAAEKLAAGTGVFAVSAVTGEGLEALSAYLRPGKTVALLGPSGAGKSSLVNALAGEALMETGGVRAGDRRGRHTTTHRQLLRLKSGVLVIDTPGMRELGMWEAREGLGHSFPDVEAHLGRCKFSDCRHESEPGCAVREAIRSGALSPERWAAYRRLDGEARFSEDKGGYLRAKQKKFKEIAKAQRRGAAPDYRREPCAERFTCKVCGASVGPEDAGSAHRNHCPHCLSSVHVDNRPGDRACLCAEVMDPIGVWVRRNGEWAIIHRCRACGALSSNRVAADDNPTLLLSIALKPLAQPPFPLWQAGGAAPEMSVGD